MSRKTTKLRKLIAQAKEGEHTIDVLLPRKASTKKGPNKGKRCTDPYSERFKRRLFVVAGEK